MSEELRPCPICGKRPSLRTGQLNGNDFHKITCCVEVGCYGTQVDKATRTMWNTAYCWKILDEALLRAKAAEDVAKSLYREYAVSYGGFVNQTDVESEIEKRMAELREKGNEE